VLEAPDARSLAEFYSRIFGWSITKHGPTWVTLGPPTGVAYIAFQTSPEYVPPVWPPQDGRQQMMMHLDVEVHDLEAAVGDAIELGARLADYQPRTTSGSCSTRSGIPSVCTSGSSGARVLARRCLHVEVG